MSTKINKINVQVPMTLKSTNFSVNEDVVFLKTTKYYANENRRFHSRVSSGNFDILLISSLLYNLSQNFVI